LKIIPAHDTMLENDKTRRSKTKDLQVVSESRSNLVTKRVEVNLHVNFLEDKPNVKGVGYRWMFDIDYLTDSMNYIPVSLENQANPHAGASEVTNSAGTSQTLSFNASEEKDEDVELIVVPSTVELTVTNFYGAIIVS
ncbi:hypothetical protein Tco_0040323, partial [Tanacetum coccineum]